MSHPTEEWNNLHDALKETLKKEVSMMRELLANMHQEEVSLMLNDPGSVNELLHQRCLIIERLGSLRSMRIETTGKIEKIATTEKSPTLQDILPVEEDTSTEIFSLRDQLMALTEQMNRQQSQNKYLTEHPEHIRSYPAQAAPRAKRKASVATYQIKK